MENSTKNSEWYNGAIEHGKTEWPTLKEMKFCYSQDQREITMSHSDNKKIGITFTEELVKRFDGYPEALEALETILKNVPAYIIHEHTSLGFNQALDALKKHSKA